MPQAGGSLRRDGYTFTGFGRAATDVRGEYSFTTLRPGPTQPDAAPFVAITVFARGLTNRLFTRAYLPLDESALGADAVLQSPPMTFAQMPPAVRIFPRTLVRYSIR